MSYESDYDKRHGIVGFKWYSNKYNNPKLTFLQLLLWYKIIYSEKMDDRKNPDNIKNFQDVIALKLVLGHEIE